MKLSKAQHSRTLIKELCFQKQIANLQTAIGDKAGANSTSLTIMELAKYICNLRSRHVPNTKTQNNLSTFSSSSTSNARHQQYRN